MNMSITMLKDAIDKKHKLIHTIIVFKRINHRNNYKRIIIQFLLYTTFYL